MALTRIQRMIIQHTVSTTDAAMFSAPGGIDLDSSMLNLQVKRDGSGVTYSTAADGVMQVNGFIPFIIRITPMASVLLPDSG